LVAEVRAREFLVQQDLQGHRANPVQKVHRVSLVLMAQMALTGPMAKKATRVTLENRVLRVKLDLRANKAFKEKPDPKVHRAYRARLELLVNKVFRASKAKQVLRVLRVILESKGHGVKLVRQVLLELLDQQGLRALREQRALKVSMVFLLIKLLLLMGSSEQNPNG
jgi:intergrase/recombinase